MDASARRRAWLERARVVAPPLGVLIWALAFRLWCRGGLDLSDLPGAGGVKIVHALTVDHFSRDLATWAHSVAMPLFFGDIERTVWTMVLLLPALASLGAYLAAAALVNRTAGVVAGLVAGTTSLLVHPSMLLGHDALALGWTWLGVGICWWGARRGPALSPLVMVGALLALLGVGTKVSALPAAGFALAAPLMVRRRDWVGSVFALVAVVIGGLIAKATYLPDTSGHVQDAPVLALESLRQGLSSYRQILFGHPQGVVMMDITVLAAVGTLLPGPRWGRRVLVGVAAAVALTLTANTIADKLRPRHFAIAWLPLVVLAGCGVGLAVDLVGALCRRFLARAPWVGHAKWGLALGLVGLLATDTVAFLNGWSALRTQYLDVMHAGLPSAPARWQVPYMRLSPFTFMDHSDPGADTLVQLARSAGPGGIGGVVLRDNREYHMLAGAGLSGRPAVVLDAQRCCDRGQSLKRCAENLVTALDEAGATLVIPSEAGIQRVPRVNQPHGLLVDHLRRAAQRKGGLEAEGRWWQVRQAAGAGGPLPCSETKGGRPRPR